jgi:hypothetical protein
VTGMLAVTAGLLIIGGLLGIGLDWAAGASSQPTNRVCCRLWARSADDPRIAWTTPRRDLVCSA